MWRFKSCPKCGGDMYVEREGGLTDPKPYTWCCLQCGKEVFTKSPALSNMTLILARMHGQREVSRVA